ADPRRGLLLPRVAAAGIRPAADVHARRRVHHAYGARRGCRPAALRLPSGRRASWLQGLLFVGDGRRRSQAGAARRSGAHLDSQGLALPVQGQRAATAAEVEKLGVVAVIRMKDADKLRAVVDAIAAGGVRAIEVTMTVPGAVGLIAKLAVSLPKEILLGAGTVTDAATARAVI